jgi:hypothetical protein
LNINLATDLREKKITRSTTLKVESISVKESLELKKREKEKGPQTNISEYGLLKATNDSFLDPSSSKEVSSLACILPPISFGCHQKQSFCSSLLLTVLKALDNQIQLLSKVNKSHYGYTELLDNIKDYNMSNSSTYQTWKLSQKCTYLSLAFDLTPKNT